LEKKCRFGGTPKVQQGKSDRGRGEKSLGKGKKSLGRRWKSCVARTPENFLGGELLKEREARQERVGRGYLSTNPKKSGSNGKVGEKRSGSAREAPHFGLWVGIVENLNTKEGP